jgi:hypothetical protein
MSALFHFKLILFLRSSIEIYPLFHKTFKHCFGRWLIQLSQISLICLYIVLAFRLSILLSLSSSIDSYIEAVYIITSSV